MTQHKPSPGNSMFKHFKNTIVGIHLLFLSVSAGLYAEQINPTKQEKWDIMSAEVDCWVDGLGLPIDKEIKDTVIILNLLGIETAASCEGHHNHGLSYPWIDIDFPQELKALRQEISICSQEIKKELESLKLKFPHLSYNALYRIPEGKNLLSLNDKYWSLNTTFEQTQMTIFEPLNQLLDEFYENHQSSHDNRLFIFLTSFARLHNIGGYRQVIRSPEQQLHKLKEYRQEMKDFTNFLKQKFFDDVR